MIFVIVSVLLSIVTTLNTSTILASNATLGQSYSISYILLCLLPIIIFLLIVAIVAGICCCILRNPKEIEYEELRTRREISNINTLLHALSSSSKLIEILNELLKEVPDNQMLVSFLNILQDIVNQTTTCNIQQNKNALETLVGFLELEENCDQETFKLLELIIDKIEKEMQDTLIERKKIMPPKYLILYKYSESLLLNEIRSQLALILPLCGSFNEKPGVFLERLLDTFFEANSIDGGLNTTQLYLYQKAPDVLIIKIQAIENKDGEYIKAKYYIIYNEILEYIFEIQQNVEGTIWENLKVRYQLRAVVHHMGSISGGHYKTYRRHGSSWYMTNDTQVEEVSFKCDVVPYIMVYEKLEENHFE